MAISYFPRFPKALWLPVLSYGFCQKEGAYKKALDEKEDIRTIDIQITHLKTLHRVWKESLSCPP